MRDVAEETARDWLALTLTGLGITFAPHEYLGGLFLGLAGAAVSNRIGREKDGWELWIVMLGAFLVSHIAAVAAHFWVPDWPIQVVMFAAGFGSRFVIRFVLKALGRIEERTDKIVDHKIDSYIGKDPK